MGPLSSEHGTYETVKDRIQSMQDSELGFLVKVLQTFQGFASYGACVGPLSSEHGTCKTVTAPTPVIHTAFTPDTMRVLGGQCGVAPPTP